MLARMISQADSMTNGRPEADAGPRRRSGGRTRWEFTRINITPTILRKKIEDLRELGAFMFTVELSVCEPRVRDQLGAVELWPDW